MTDRRRTILRSKRRHTNKKLWHIFLGSTIAIFVGAFFFTVWNVARMPSLTISAVRVEGVETLATADIEKRVDETMRGAYWGIIPKRFLYLYPTQAIVSALESIDRVSEATVRTEQNALVISVSEFKPNALWCKANDVASDCYFINTSGIAYEKAPTLIGGTMPRFYIEGKEPRKDEVLLPQELLARLTALSESLAQTFALQVQDFTIHEATDVTLTLTSGAEIRIDTTDSVEQIFSNISSILNAKEFENLKTGDFEYIDLRFGNKVFVEEEPPLDTSTTTSEAVE